MGPNSVLFNHRSIRGDDGSLHGTGSPCPPCPAGCPWAPGWLASSTDMADMEGRVAVGFGGSEDTEKGVARRNFNAMRLQSSKRVNLGGSHGSPSAKTV